MVIHQDKEFHVWGDRCMGRSMEGACFFHAERMLALVVLEWNWAKDTALKEATIKHRTLMANFSVKFVLDLSFQALAIRARILFY